MPKMLKIVISLLGMLEMNYMREQSVIILKYYELKSVHANYYVFWTNQNFFSSAKDGYSNLGTWTKTFLI